MVPFIPELRRRVLDIGCAQGRFLAQLPGVEERWGVEPSVAAEVAATRLDKVLHATYDGAEAALPLGYFDVILCNDVIEHMVDHDAFLERVKPLLRPGGVLIASIPNVRHIWNLFDLVVKKQWRYTDWGILDRTHLRFFTKRSIGETLVRHGYDVELLQGFNSAMEPWRGVASFVKACIMAALVVGTFGHAADTLYLQFLVRARLR